MATKPIVLAVEGLIGAGKSTLLSEFEKTYKDLPEYTYKVVQESLSKYTKWEYDRRRHNPLALAYDHPRENIGFTQLHIIRAHNETFRRALRRSASNGKRRPHVILTDRSLFSPLAFIENAFASGFIPEFVRDCLVEEAHRLAWASAARCRLATPLPKGVFFVDTSPEVCVRRVQERGRYYEKVLDLKRLKALRACYLPHLQWLASESSDVVHCKRATAEKLHQFILLQLKALERTKERTKGRTTPIRRRQRRARKCKTSQ